MFKGLITGLLGTTMLVPIAYSQEAQNTSDEENKSSAEIMMDTITVRGTKRLVAETAQNVPGQVAAFGAAQLDARHVVNLQDLSRSTPNVQMEGIGTMPGTANFSFRGQGINSSIPSVDPTVGVFIDGVYLGSTYGVITDMFDLEAVEIHKGPQGVLAGRNSVGGAVMLRTARPDGSTRVKGKFGIESGLQYTGALSVQAPVVEDKLAAKIAVQYKHDNGYFENTTTGGKSGKEKSFLIRPTMVFTPNENFDATVIWEHGDVKGDSSVSQDSSGDFTTLAPALHHRTAREIPGELTMKWDQLTLEMNLDMGNGRFTNISGYRAFNLDSEGELDGTALDLFQAHVITDYSQKSNELRYTSMVTDAWEITAGLFYFESEFTYSEGRNIFGGVVQYGGQTQQEHKTTGIFINNNVELTDQLSLQAGLRYTTEEKSVKINALKTCTYDFTCPNPAALADNKWNNWSPKVGLQWEAMQDVNVYAHFSRGYRAGGYNARSAVVPLQSYEPERVDNFEIGLKSKTMDGKLRLNAAAFINKIDAMQREVRKTVGADTVQDIFNTSNATVKGFEIDALYVVTEAFAINASAGYLTDKYTKMTADLSQDGLIDATDLALKLPRLAEWTLNVGAVYDIELSSGVLSTRIDYSYRSDIFYNDSNTSIIPSTSVVDLGVKYAPNDADWTASLYAKNLTDAYVTGQIGSLGLAPYGSNYLSPMIKGRVFGANVQFDF